MQTIGQGAINRNMNKTGALPLHDVSKVGGKQGTIDCKRTKEQPTRFTNYYDPAT